MSRLEDITVVSTTLQGIVDIDAQILDHEAEWNVNIKMDVFCGRKNLDTVKSELEGKVLSLWDIDNYMVESGYESILPADIDNINNTGLIWYPFEPFLNQINIWVECDGENYRIEAVEHFSDCDNKDGTN